VEKYGTAVRVTDTYITMRKRFACVIIQVTNTLRICNTSCVFMETMVTRTRLIVTSHVHCLYGLDIKSPLLLVSKSHFSKDCNTSVFFKITVYPIDDNQTVKAFSVVRAPCV
jgi:hypothetical protein